MERRQERSILMGNSVAKNESLFKFLARMMSKLQSASGPGIGKLWAGRGRYDQLLILLRHFLV